MTINSVAVSWSNTSGGKCNYRQDKTTTTYKMLWKYDKLPVDISLLKSGTDWNSSFQWPVGAGGSNKTINWGGCIEERKTAKQSTYSPIPSSAYDLNIDLVPTSNADTQWAPVLPDLTFTRDSTGTSTGSNWDINPATVTTEYRNTSSYYCPTEAKKLQTWPNASLFDDYVDSLTPTGNTYHDIGLIWGARFASPDGLFASDNQFTPQGGEIERHIIFMTDGETNAINTDYAA